MVPSDKNHVPWGRLSLWKWVPGISPGVKVAVAFGRWPTTLVVPKVKKIWGLNLPGTPTATSACRGIPLLFFICYKKKPAHWEFITCLYYITPNLNAVILTYIVITRSRVSFNFLRLSFKTFSFNGGGCSTLYSAKQKHKHFNCKQHCCNNHTLFHYYVIQTNVLHQLWQETSCIKILKYNTFQYIF